MYLTGTGVREPAQREQCVFCWELGTGWRKDDVRPLCRVSAWCTFLQCFHTVGWV